MSEHDGGRPTATVSWRGSTVVVDRFPITIGRDGHNQVVIDGDGVSRRHVRLDHDGQHFVITDDSSTNGTYIDGRRVQRYAFDDRLQLRLGRAQSAQVVEISPLGAGSAAAPLAAVTTNGTLVAEQPTVAPELDGPTVLPPRNGTRISDVDGARHASARSMSATPAMSMPFPTPIPLALDPRGADAALSEQTSIGGDVLRVHVNGRSVEIHPGRERVIGRDRGCDLVVDHPLVSRRHAALRYDGSHWYLDDLDSAHGTFVDGRQVRSSRLGGPVAVWLGGVDTGAALTVQAPGVRRRSLRTRLASRRLAPVTVVVASLAAVAGVLALVVGPLRRPSPASVTLLQQAAVRIETPSASGSGTIISADRMILTNAHVAAPDAVGQGLLQDVHHRTPPHPVASINVYVTRRLGETSGYKAAVVAADGYLDLAVIRLVASIDGGPLPSTAKLDLPHVSIASLAHIEQGTRLRVLGFPTVAGASTVTLTEGAVSGFSTDPRLGGRIGFVVTDASIGHGNSGGLAADEHNRLVGVPTARRTQDRDAVTVLRPAELALPMLKAVHDGKPYVSPYVKDKRNEQFDKLALVVPSDAAGIELACVAAPVAPALGASAVALSFTYAGFPADRQDLAVTIRRPNETAPLGATSVGDGYPGAWSESGCATVTVKIDKPLGAGTYIVEVWVGGNVVLAKDLTFTIAEPNTPGAPASATANATTTTTTTTAPATATAISAPAAMPASNS